MTVSFLHKKRGDLMVNAGTGSALPESNKVHISLYPQDCADHQGFEMEWKEMCGRCSVNLLLKLYCCRDKLKRPMAEHVREGDMHLGSHPCRV